MNYIRHADFAQNFVYFKIKCDFRIGYKLCMKLCNNIKIDVIEQQFNKDS
jgi:hypothetical protein